MIPVTCSTRRECARNRGHCSPRFPGWSLLKFQRPPSAAAPREYSTSCSPMPPMRLGTAKRRLSLRGRRMWWQREILDVFCKCHPHSHDTARRSLWCTRFNSWMHPFVASRSNRCAVNPFLPTATRRECPFSWRCHAIHLRPAKSAARRSCATLVPSPVLDRGESASRWYPQRTYSGDYIKSGYTEKINRAKRAAMLRVNGLAIAANEKINGHGRSDQDDKGFHPGLR